MQIVSVSLQKYSAHITQTSFRVRVKQGRKLFSAPLTFFLSLYSKRGTVRKCREFTFSVQFFWLNADKIKAGKKRIVLKSGLVSCYKVARSPNQMCAQLLIGKGQLKSYT